MATEQTIRSEIAEHKEIFGGGNEDFQVYMKPTFEEPMPNRQKKNKMPKKQIYTLAQTMEIFGSGDKQLPMAPPGSSRLPPAPMAPSDTESAGMTSDGNWDIPAATGADDIHMTSGGEDWEVPATGPASQTELAWTKRVKLEELPAASGADDGRKLFRTLPPTPPYEMDGATASLATQLSCKELHMLLSPLGDLCEDTSAEDMHAYTADIIRLYFLRKRSKASYAACEMKVPKRSGSSREGIHEGMESTPAAPGAAYKCPSCLVDRLKTSAKCLLCRCADPAIEQTTEATVEVKCKNGTWRMVLIEDQVDWMFVTNDGIQLGPAESKALQKPYEVDLSSLAWPPPAVLRANIHEGAESACDYNMDTAASGAETPSGTRSDIDITGTRRDEDMEVDFSETSCPPSSPDLWTTPPPASTLSQHRPWRCSQSSKATRRWT